jgi:hypothetical protein
MISCPLGSQANQCRFRCDIFTTLGRYLPHASGGFGLRVSVIILYRDLEKSQEKPMAQRISYLGLVALFLALIFPDYVRTTTCNLHFCERPGSRGLLPAPSPLRTGHDSFPSQGSSPSKANLGIEATQQNEKLERFLSGNIFF